MQFAGNYGLSQIVPVLIDTTHLDQFIHIIQVVRIGIDVD